jgi:hypothetical protein
MKPRTAVVNDALSSRLDELESLTRDYARYSRSAGGMASVLGGGFALAAWLGGGLLPSSTALRVMLVALPLVWVAVRQLLVHRYYQRYGHVEEQAPRAVRITHGTCVATVVVVAMVVTFSLLTRPQPLAAGDYGYLALVWLLAPVTWFWLRSPLDFIVGTFLFCQAAVACAGFAYPVPGTAAAAASPAMTLLTLMFPLAALVFIVNGVTEHRRFLALCRRMTKLRQDVAA